MTRYTNIDLRQLRYFVSVVDAGSITKASRLHHIAQPALSKRIQSLEDDLGVPLLHRGHLGVQATEQGMILYQAAQRVLRDMELVVDLVKAAPDDPVGNVRIGCLNSLTTLIAAPLTVAALERLPKVRLSIVAGQSVDLYRGLLDGALDIALFVQDSEATSTEIDLLVEEEIFIAVGSGMTALPDRPQLDVEDLREAPFIFPTAKTFATGRQIIGVLQRAGVELKVVAEVDGEAIKNLIAGGYGCCVMPWANVNAEVARGDITLRTLKGMPMKRNLIMCGASDRPRSLAARAVAELMAEIVETLVSRGAWRHARLLGTTLSNRRARARGGR